MTGMHLIAVVAAASALLPLLLRALQTHPLLAVRKELVPRLMRRLPYPSWLRGRPWFGPAAFDTPTPLALAVPRHETSSRCRCIDGAAAG